MGDEKSSGVFIIGPNGDLTVIADIEDGKRKAYPWDVRTTWKKVAKIIGPEAEFAGTYAMDAGENFIFVLRENGTVEFYALG